MSKHVFYRANGLESNLSRIIPGKVIVALCSIWNTALGLLTPLLLLPIFATMLVNIDLFKATYPVHL